MHTSFVCTSKDELSTYGELLLRGTRIVIPKILRDKVVKLAHEGHQGVVKTKYRLRSKVWWPGMDKDVEELCKRCHGCQVTSSYGPPEPMCRVLPPSAPWQDCNVGLLGPLPTGETIWVVIDYFSRFLEVAIMKCTTSSKVIEAMTPMLDLVSHFPCGQIMIPSLYRRSSRRFYERMVSSIRRQRHFGLKLMVRSSDRIALCSNVCRSHSWRERTGKLS